MRPLPSTDSHHAAEPTRCCQSVDWWVGDVGRKLRLCAYFLLARCRKLVPPCRTLLLDSLSPYSHSIQISPPAAMRTLANGLTAVLQPSHSASEAFHSPHTSSSRTPIAARRQQRQEAHRKARGHRRHVRHAQRTESGAVEPSPQLFGSCSGSHTGSCCRPRSPLRRRPPLLRSPTLPAVRPLPRSYHPAGRSPVAARRSLLRAGCPGHHHPRGMVSSPRALPGEARARICVCCTCRCCCRCRHRWRSCSQRSGEAEA